MEITEKLLDELIEKQSKRYHSISPGVVGSTTNRETRPKILGKIQMLRELKEILKEKKKIDYT